jgi:molecular chaperone DnaK
MTGITIGIDLGTTNSVACIKKINVSTLRNAEGNELTPSSVTAVPNADNTDFDIVVGSHSRDLLKQYPEQTIISVKRLMGRDFEDTEVQNIINTQRVTYPITTDASEPNSIKILLGKEMQSPETISGIILKKIIRDSENELQGKVEQAVVTVPAYFSDRQKFATRAACDVAGIRLLRLLPEPTAAALSFGLDKLNENECRTIMVFDLGGGTFDISVLSFAGESFMEITKGGDMWLGGDDIDTLMVNHVFAKTQATAKCKPVAELIEMLAPTEKARFIAEIKEKAEAAKIQLSTEDSANIELFGILKDENHKLLDIDVTITRDEFSQLITPIVKRVSSIAKQILHEIRFEPALIDTVLMVGGSSLVPAIQDELKNLFGAEKVMIHPRPMLAIAEGAALMASKMMSASGEDKSFTMMHTSAHDYYLQLAGGKRHLLIARNTPLPATIEEELKFSHIDQALARLRVFNVVDGISETVGELWFHKDLDDYALEGEPTKFKMQFSVDEDNIITMKAWSLKKEAHVVETQIARGSVSAKLYNELENTLSSIIAQASREAVTYNALYLSRQIVSTILSASDPVTGSVNNELKKKAEKQINMLKRGQEKDLAPYPRYRFALHVKKEAWPVLKEVEKSRLESLIDEFSLALHTVDVEKFEQLDEEISAFYEDVPIASILGRARNIIESLHTYNNPEGGNSIRKQIKKVVDAYQRDDQMIIEKETENLEEIIYGEYSFNEQPTRRFDRDVNL